MDVFASRVRRAYLKKRSVPEMVAATLLLLAVVAACGIAGGQDEEDRVAMSAEFRPGQRNLIVASWTESEVLRGNR